MLGVLPAAAQLSGRISGSVADQSGAAAPGATVNLYLAGGDRPLLSTTTAADGTYNFIGVRSADYDLTVEATGFLKYTLRGIVADPARETSVPAIKLALPSVSQSVEVTADVQGVEITNAEISGTISMEEIRNLPILDRDALSILQTQPGVVANANSTTVINGLRTSFSDVTLDGVNIQDNYIRDNALDFTPNKLQAGQVRSMTIVSANGNAAMSGGATETAFSTPSGTNQFHGEAYWYNRNNYFSANDWFNNQSGIARPFLNQNELGAIIGGPIRKDKLFFYGNYEAVRAHQQTPVTNTILTADARNGIFTYNSGGVTRKVNLLALRNTTIDPAIQALLNQIPGPAQINSNTVGDGRNNGGYRFNMRDNETRDNATGKLDYNLSARQAVSGTYAWNRQNLDRPDAENDFSVVPKAYNPNHTDFLAASWRWTPSARITNELRGGFNLNFGDFVTSQKFGPYLLTGMIFSDPVNEFLPQGRNTKTYVLSDNAAYSRGRHFIQFGFHMQQIRVRGYDAAGTLATYSLAMGSGQPALLAKELPGISSTDLAAANALLANLGGYIDTSSQTFNVASRTSGFVPGAQYVRHDKLSNYAIYIQDKWRLLPRLTLTLGLRYEMPGVVDERNALQLAPIVQGGAVQTLLSNATLDFTGSAVGRPWYHRYWKDFGPNFGFAWNVFGDGKTALRGGYSLSYVNDQEILAPEDLLTANAGLQSVVAVTGLSNRVSSGVPPIDKPAFQVPLKVSDNYANNVFNTVGLIDPNLHRPYVQQYSFGIQHEFKQTVLEARYVGNHVVGAYRAFDFNQVIVKQNGFLADFLRAQQNGLRSLAARGVFSPAYSPTIPGSQPLPVFNKLARGAINDPNAISMIQTGQVGELATYYQVNGYNPVNAVPFFQNPYALGTDILANYSSSSYNSLQLEARHRMRSGLSFEANYTFSKVLSDANGDIQSRIQQFLDINSPKIERSRANFDLTHMIKADGFYEIPIGEGHRLRYGPLDRVIGGWTFGSTMVLQSGTPFSILSGYATLNRGTFPFDPLDSASRSYYNTANTALTKSQLDGLVKFQMTGNGPIMIAQSAINPADGTGVTALGTPAFAGEVFYNPGAGTLGGLQRRMFDGPWTFDIDMRLKKTVNITESQKVELLMDAFNALNHATFFSRDQNINSTKFGVINSTFYSRRLVQFGLHYRF